MTVPGGYVAGDTLSAANMNLLPGGMEAGGYAQVTSAQTGITTIVDVTSLTVTWTAVSARRYRTSFFVDVLPATVADTNWGIEVSITDGSNTVKASATSAVTTTQVRTLVGSVVETSLSGSTTRKLRTQSVNNSSSDAYSINAAATQPCYILVEDVGPA